MKTIRVIILAVISIAQVNVTMAAENNDIEYLQQRWAEVNYQLEGNNQLSAFEQLMSQSEEFIESNPDDAGIWIWSAIINSTYAGAKGGIGALKFAKQAKQHLEKAIELDGDALQGSAYTSLGTLYFNVPGWPIGFGNDKKAEELLLQALALNPEGIDTNYFYGQFLAEEKRYDEARDYYAKAQQASPRLNRPIADAGRQQEIIEAIAQIRDK